MAQHQSEIAFAKINLALHVRARRGDGYHELETIFAFVDDGDFLTADTQRDLTLEIVGPFAKGLEIKENLVLQVARVLREHGDINAGAKLTLDKRLPVASGIGGGSADAAAALRLLNRLWGLNLNENELATIGAPLGADVAACVFSHTCVGTGVGEQLALVEDSDLSDLHCLLVNPGIAVVTGPVFEAWDGVDRGGLAKTTPLKSALAGRNDLQDPAIKIAPEIAVIIKVFEGHSPVLTRMSGSGATCFALFENANAAQAAQQDIEKQRPAYWTMIGRLRDAGHG